MCLENLGLLPAEKSFFVGVDSDGCVFDTMELKQKECFVPMIIQYFDLQALCGAVRETAEFVNLYSRWRGSNRFPALVRTMELLKCHPGVKGREERVPDLSALADWIGREAQLGNPALARAVEVSGDGVLRRVLDWSVAVNDAVAGMVRNLAPFAFVREALERVGACADVFVISQTPHEAIFREWEALGLLPLVSEICGQEYGPKAEQLRAAAVGKYALDRILMVGDALGDEAAARANGACFFPICPGAEEASWKRFLDEGLGRFLRGEFRGDYEGALFEDFSGCLPEVPPWC